MLIKTRIRLADQLPVEALLADAAFVSCHQKNGVTPGIKCESSAPDAICRIEAQSLHVGVPRSAERVHARPPKLRPEMRQNFRLSKQFIRYVQRKRIELWLKLVVKNDQPRRTINMPSNAYIVKNKRVPLDR